VQKDKAEFPAAEAKGGKLEAIVRKIVRLYTKKPIFCICSNVMKVVNRKYQFVTEEDLIEACLQKDRRAQKVLYDRYSPVMYGVCKRYVKSPEDAEDVLVEAFYKVLTNLHQYKGSGSFEGWIRRIVVNESLMFLRKRHNFRLTLEISEVDQPTTTNVINRMAAEDILGLLSKLPTGYRTVFNLYVLEGYKHREIADMLGISINTSKSQLILAKKKMQDMLEDFGYPGLQKFNK
jgi:RNA polymerase sigma-70 factor (ECF subfamily)